MKSRVGSSSEYGFSLIETMVAMAIVSIVLMTLAGLTSVVAQRSISSSAIAHRDAALAVAAGRMGVLPFDSLQTRVGCATVTGQAFPHQTCIAVTMVSANVQQVQVVVTPTNVANRPDTVAFERTKF